MRRYLRAVTVTAALLPQSSVHADTDAADISQVIAIASAPIVLEADQTVVSVSPDGNALVVTESRTELCLVSVVDGARVQCADVGEPSAGIGAAWSSDGTALVTFESPISGPDLEPMWSYDVDADRAVVLPGTTADGEPFVAFYPAFLDRDTVTFLRADAANSPELPNLEIVRVTTSGDEVGAAPTGLRAVDLLPQVATVIGDTMLISQTTDDGAELLALSPDGAVATVATTDQPVLAARGTWSARDSAVVVSAKSDRLAGPLTYIDANLTPQVAEDVNGIAATISPDGNLVGAVVSEDETLILTLWDPRSDRSRPLIEVNQDVGQVTWTRDDRIVIWDADGWQVVTIIGR